MSGVVASWDIAAVCGFLEGIGLHALVPAFKDNAVNGKDLLDLTDEDFRDSLGCSNLQVRLILSKAMKSDLQHFDLFIFIHLAD